ncbi:calcium/sodium antiporter [Fertoebacter nigrum]|uniref:Calcium/sodium antiporter n=1 Tax=Fertoeibacter niger TaxID=2656921 RepID=A0A8X8GT36_9RHOB|nr:calcium/sodium antiporter [Fertoeibacter niger]NUB43833.1 calcium/sodium antiporter [Fertoeibacter niger]
MTYILFTIGLIGLFFGGEFLVRGASNIARAYRISPMVIGLTIVGFGTSTPELLVSLNAALDGAPAIAIGNVLGSNIANILLILGLSALITPIIAPLSRLWRDLAVMMGASALIWLMLLDGAVSRLDGAVLFAGLIGFLVMSFMTVRVDPPQDAPSPPPMWQSLLFTIGGLVILMVGARLLVDSATEIARTFGISEAVIGLTIVAVGTSLPELATSLIAAWRKQMDIAVGNIIGSNIFNILGILGLTTLIAPITTVDPRFAGVDMLWVAGSAAAVVVFVVLAGRIPRLGGAALLAAYAGYVALMNV